MTLTPRPPLPQGEGSNELPSPTGRRAGVEGLRQKAKALRKRQTNAESILWEKLRSRKLNNLKFRRQHPIRLGYIIDFYCQEYKLGIEIDGRIHDQPEHRENDEYRTLLLKEQGIKIIRFRNEEIFNSMEQVLTTIQNLTGLPSPYGRRVGDEGAPDKIVESVG